MTTSAQLRAVAITALTGTTDAGTNVFSPRDLATWNSSYPVLLVTIEDEDGDGLGPNGAPQFNVTATLRVQGRVQESAEVDDVGAALALAALESLRDQIKVAVINYTPLMVELQQFSSFKSRMQVGGKEPGDAYHHGQVVVDIGLQFYQGPDDFNQPTDDALEEVNVTVSAPSGTTENGLTITLPQ